MADIKSVMGAVIVVLGVTALASMFIANVFKLKLPRFLMDNRIEIALLTIVSCIMGLALIIL